MSIKVCHVTWAHKRYDPRIFYKECTSLANAGYDVTLLVADNKAPEVRNGVKIISADFRPKTWVDRRLRSGKVMFQKAVPIDADIYHLHDPSLLSAAKKLKQLGKKVIFDVHENYPGQILLIRKIPSFLRRPCSAAFSLYEKDVLGKVDYVIGVTPSRVEELRRFNTNVEMITNFPILGFFDLAEDSNHTPTKPKANVITFAGGIREEWSHEIILQAIENLEVRYKLAGWPNDNKYLNRLMRLPSWKKVEYMGRISQEEVAKMFQQCAIGMAVIQYNQNTYGKYGTLGNTKLFEYMQAGLPVICTDLTLWRAIIEKWHCGICVNPSDVSAIRDAISFLIQNPNKAANMGANGQKAVREEYNWATQEPKLLALYKKVLA